MSPTCWHLRLFGWRVRTLRYAHFPSYNCQILNEALDLDVGATLSPPLDLS